MRRLLLPLAGLTLVGFCALPCCAQTIPPIQAKALDGSEVILPKPGSQQLLILVVGFSHKSGEACRAWGKRLAVDYASDPHTVVYQLAELQGAPSMVRGFIVRGMRKDVPPAQQSRFVPLFDHEADWKKTVNFSAPDDAYLVVADPEGHALWQTHGLVNDSAYTDLQAAISKFSANTPKL
ncbi:MAG: hypothetical protein WBL63_12795 [Candidatus Acidiferrum sp.]